MFISIFLNEWFAEALHDSIQRKNNSRQYEKIADFMGMSRKAPEIPRADDKPDRYAVYAFTVSESIFSAEDLLSWQENKSSVPLLFFRTEDKKVYFDVLNPWDQIIRDGSAYYSYWAKEKPNSRLIRILDINRQKEWASVVNTLSNVNIILLRWKKYLMPGYASPQKLNGMSWIEKILEEYKKGVVLKDEDQRENVADEKGFAAFLRENNLRVKKCVDRNMIELNSLQTLFICNEYNLNSYYKAFMKKYAWLFNAQSDEWSMQQILNTLTRAIEDKTKLPLDPENLYKDRENIGGEIWKKNKQLENIFYASQMVSEIMQYARRISDGEETHTVEEIAEKVKEIKDKYKGWNMMVSGKEENLSSEAQDNANASKASRKKKKEDADTDTESQSE